MTLTWKKVIQAPVLHTPLNKNNMTKILAPQLHYQIMLTMTCVRPMPRADTWGGNSTFIGPHVQIQQIHTQYAWSQIRTLPSV